MGINIALWCYIVMASDMALRGSKGLDFAMISSGWAGYSQQAVPFLPHDSSSISLHNAQTVLLLFIYHVS